MRRELRARSSEQNVCLLRVCHFPVDVLSRILDDLSLSGRVAELFHPETCSNARLIFVETR